MPRGGRLTQRAARAPATGCILHVYFCLRILHKRATTHLPDDDVRRLPRRRPSSGWHSNHLQKAITMNDDTVKSVHVDASAVSFEACSTWAEDFRGAVLRHYTGSKGAPVGKKQGWRVYEHVGRITNLIGWIGLGEPTYKLAPRRRLGLQDARPLERTVNNFIFRLEGARLTSAREILRRWMPIAAECWERRYGWRPIHWETMVGQGDAKVLGACFRGARWRRLGWTTGRTARRQTGNAHGKRVWSDATPKLVFYFGPLAREAR